MNTQLPQQSSSVRIVAELETLINDTQQALETGNPALPDMLIRQRAAYHKALLIWYREHDQTQGLEKILEVFTQIHAVAHTARLQHLMCAAQALTIGLQHQIIPVDTSIKQLYAQTDRVFKRLIEQGEAAGMQVFPLDLLYRQLQKIADIELDHTIVQQAQKMLCANQSLQIAQAEDMVAPCAQDAMPIHSLQEPETPLTTPAAGASDEETTSIQRTGELQIEALQSVVAEDSEMHQPQQLMLEPDSSTAQDIAPLVARNIGLDMLLNEVKTLGGKLEISANTVQGTDITLHLPDALAITEVLLIKLHAQIYAVNCNNIEGVVRIAHDDMQKFLSGERTYFAYGKQRYQLCHLDSLLTIPQPTANKPRPWYPCLLVCSSEQSIALRVDDLLGNHQIVVKSLGPQLSTIRWFNGGTILPDGRIALLLDIANLLK